MSEKVPYYIRMIKIKKEIDCMGILDIRSYISSVSKLTEEYKTMVSKYKENGIEPLPDINKGNNTPEVFFDIYSNYIYENETLTFEITELDNYIIEIGQNMKDELGSPEHREVRKRLKAYVNTLKTLRHSLITINKLFSDRIKIIQGVFKYLAIKKRYSNGR